MADEMKTKNREKQIVRTSVIGVVINLAMAVMKAMIGILSNSIAILLDAVNNLSDALSSVITIIGAKLGALPPNKKHPLGYGRMEYISSMLVSAIVIYAGISSLVESVKKIITPESAEYNMTSILILLVAIVVKILLGSYVKRQGKKLESVALTASGTEAVMDAFVSAAVVVSAVVYMKWEISLEAYVGVIIAVLIIKAGIEMMLETLDDILGKRFDRDEVKKIKQVICEEPEVRGAYDLTVFNYGPEKNYASVHIELPDTMNVKQVDVLMRRIQERVFMERGVLLTGISIYSYNTSNDEAAAVRDEVQKIINNQEWQLQMHGFYLDRESSSMRFDLVIHFEDDKDKVLETVQKEIQKKYPDYTIYIAVDIDV